MQISHSNNPFLHATISNLLTKEENDILYEMCEKACEPYSESIDDLSFFILPQDRHLLDKHGISYCRRSGIVNNNVGVPLGSSNNAIYQNIQSRIYDRLSQPEFTNIFPILHSEHNGNPLKWGAGLCITSDYTTHQLLPHTDNPDELIEYGKKNNIQVSCGRYKGVIFITKDGLDYSHYGTRFYKTNSRSSEFLEEPYIGGNACMFKTGPDSWHGTHFKKGLPNRRYTITIEYY